MRVPNIGSIVEGIEDGTFDWRDSSWVVAEYCPHHFDPEKYNWADFSVDVLEYCPEHFDPEKFNWEDYSYAVLEYCPEHFDPEKFNWEKDSWAVAKHCPHHFDPVKFNWEDVHSVVSLLNHAPQLLSDRKDGVLLPSGYLLTLTKVEDKKC